MKRTERLCRGPAEHAIHTVDVDGPDGEAMSARVPCRLK
jgi:hypothetical protein